MRWGGEGGMTEDFAMRTLLVLFLRILLEQRKLQVNDVTQGQAVYRSRSLMNSLLFVVSFWHFSTRGKVSEPANFLCCSSRYAETSNDRSNWSGKKNRFLFLLLLLLLLLPFFFFFFKSFFFLSWARHPCYA